jgi:hypothetical protein
VPRLESVNRSYSVALTVVLADLGVEEGSTVEEKAPTAAAALGLESEEGVENNPREDLVGEATAVARVVHREA